MERKGEAENERAWPARATSAGRRDGGARGEGKGSKGGWTIQKVYIKEEDTQLSKK